VSGAPPTDRLAALESAAFAPFVGRSFRLHASDETVLEVRLSHVSEANPTTARAARERGHRAPFALLFHGPAAPVLPQRIYRIEEDELGALDLFLVPLGPDEHGMRYEAIFA